MVVNYQNGKIYKIWSLSSNLIYIGSTTQELNKRLAGHIRSYKNYLKTNKNKCAAFELLKLNDYKIELIELYKCNSKKELERREGIIQRENKENLVNLYIAGRTKKELLNEEGKRIRERDTIRYKTNEKRQIECQKRAKEYVENNRDKVKAYQHQYKVDNKSKAQEYAKQYQEKNKLTLSQYYKEHYNKTNIIYMCICGSNVSSHNKNRHEKSKHHLSYVSEKEVGVFD